MNKTTYQIFDSPAGKTIIFHNLYCINGEYVFNGSVSSSEISTYPNVHYRHTNFKLWHPAIAELSEDDSITTIVTPHFYLKESLHGHPGHTLMDDIFSVFYSLYRCKNNYNPCVCIVETLDNKISSYDCKGMFKCLFGQEAITDAYLKQAYSKVCFKTFIVGNGDSGFSSYDCNYVSPFQNSIWKQFRDAFYEKSEISLEPASRIIYVDANPSINDPIRDVLKNNNIEIVCWGNMPLLDQQLNTLKDVKIYITTDGSAALNVIFLPDNSIVINLGRVYANDKYSAIGYCEDYLYPSLPYIDVFYIEDYYNNHKLTFNPDDLMHMIKWLCQKDSSILIKRAEVYAKFASKITGGNYHAPKLDNLSPNARLLIEHYPNVEERSKIIEGFKRGNVAFACNEKIRSFVTA